MTALRKIKFLLQHPLSILKYLKQLLQRRCLFFEANLVNFRDIYFDFIKLKPKFFDITELFPNISYDTIVSNADKICEHKFDLLGSGIKDLGKNINWREDFKTSHVWPLSPFYKIKIPYGKSDVKMPWELSRFYHLPTLAKAYFITKNDKYAKEFEEEILDWIEQNPAYFGPNWMNAMEVGIRVANFLISYLFFDNLFLFNKKFKEQFLILIYLHAKYILNNLENIGIKSNHYLSDIVGLLYIGILMPNLKISKKCLNFSLKELENEMENQVYDDGVDFEASISYHRLVTELFGYAALLCKLNNINLSKAFWRKLRKMFGFVWYYTKPNGLAPQIGDNDDGRLHLIFEDYYKWDKRDHRHLFQLYEHIYGNSIYKDFPTLESKEFPNAGIYIMRSKDSYCIIDCGSNGQNGNGGHAHNDTLSFELNISGLNFIVDPGAYVYTSDPIQRNHFRSTKMHNTVAIDSKEQNRFIRGSLFTLKNDTIPKVNKWESNKEKDFLDAQHSGYLRLKYPVLHKRQFKFDKINDCLEIIDIFRGKAKHKLEWNFHFDAGIKLNASNKLIEAEKNSKKIKIYLPENLYYEIFEDYISYSYGVKIKAPVLRLSYQGIVDNKEFKILIKK